MSLQRSNRSVKDIGLTTRANKFGEMLRQADNLYSDLHNDLLDAKAELHRHHQDFDAVRAILDRMESRTHSDTRTHEDLRTLRGIVG